MSAELPWRALLDSNAFDALVDTPGALEAAVRLREAGVTELLSTQFVEEEVAQAPPARAAHLHQVPRTRIPHHGWVLGRSALGEMRLADISNEELERGRHFEDAMHRITARREKADLITADRRLARRAREWGGTVVHPVDFVEVLLELLRTCCGPAS